MRKEREERRGKTTTCVLPLPSDAENPLEKESPWTLYPLTHKFTTREKTAHDDDDHILILRSIRNLPLQTRTTKFKSRKDDAGESTAAAALGGVPEGSKEYPLSSSHWGLHPSLIVKG